MPQDTPYKPSGWAIFDQVLGGRTITDARDTLIAREQARRAREQEMDALAAFGQTVRGMMGGSPGGAGAPDPVSAEMGMLSGGMQDAPGPKTYSAPIGPGMDGEPLPGVREPAPRPMPQQAQRQPASLPAGPPRLPTYRDFAPIVAEAVMSGNPTVAARANALAGIFDKAGPDVEFVNGLGVDKRDSGSVGRFIPSLDKGQEPLFDSNGRIVAVRNMDGSVKAAADMAGAVAGAQELAKAGLDPNAFVEMGDGTARQMTRAQAAAALGGGSGGLPALPGSTGPRAPVSPASGAPGGFGVRQSPAQEEAAKLEARRVANLGSLSTQDRQYITTVREQASQLSNAVDLAKEFVRINEDVSTGGIKVLPGVKSLNAAFDPRVATMKGIQDRLTPAMRQGMPGAASDRDVRMFASATVNLDKPGPANQAAAVAIEGGARRMGEYVEFLEDYTQRNGSLMGAQEQWNRYAAANPLYEEDANGGIIGLRKTTPWREWLQPQGSGQTTSAAPPPTQRRAGQIYQTPRGPMKWTGTGWLPQ